MLEICDTLTKVMDFLVYARIIKVVEYLLTNLVSDFRAAPIHEVVVLFGDENKAVVVRIHDAGCPLYIF